MQLYYTNSLIIKELYNCILTFFPSQLLSDCYHISFYICYKPHIASLILLIQIVIFLGDSTIKGKKALYVYCTVPLSIIFPSYL